MDDRTELHWRYLQDNLEHSRHHESLRASVSNLILIIAGASFAVVGFDENLSTHDVPLLAFVAALGVFGALFSAKQAERATLHYQRARELRDAIDFGPHSPDFKLLKNQADEKHNARFPRLSRFELRGFWSALHFSVSLLAFIMLGAITLEHGGG